MGICEYCHKYGVIHKHHIYSRGSMGKSPGTNHHYNLIALCPLHHTQVHHGHIAKQHLLSLVAAREQVTPDEVQQTLYQQRNRSRWDVNGDDVK